MAYMSQENKKQIEVVVKAICKRHGVKATVAVRHHSTLVLNISEGRVDFFADRVRDSYGEQYPFAQEAEKGSMDINVYSWRRSYTGAALAFLAEVMPALNEGNWDKSDIQTDYFNVGWYVDVNVGRWNKPYRLNPSIVADWFTECAPATADAETEEPAPVAPPASPCEGCTRAPSCSVRASYPEILQCGDRTTEPVPSPEPTPAQKAAATRRANLRLVTAPEYLTVPIPFEMPGLGRA